MSYENLLGIRSAFLLGEKYRLDLSWERVEYNRDGVCKLLGARFSGPALGFAEEIHSNDKIALDFYRQYYVKVKNIYIAELRWGKVTYNANNTVSLDDCIILHKEELNNVPKFEDSDIIIIDTKGHDVETHNLHFTYNAYVTNVDGQVYNFIHG